VYILYARHLLRRGNTIQQFAVGLVYAAVVNLTDIHLCGLRRSVPQRLRDDGQIDIRAIGHAGPGVTGHIGSKCAADACHFRETVQQAVVMVAKFLVLLYCSLIQNGKDKGAVGHRVSINNLLHRPFHLDAYPLAGLVALIFYVAIAHLFLAQEGDINQGHAQRIETEEEQVANKGQLAACCQCQVAKTADVFGGNRTLVSSGVTGEDRVEDLPAHRLSAHLAHNHPQ